MLWFKQKTQNSIPSVALQMSANTTPARQFEAEQEGVVQFWLCLIIDFVGEKRIGMLVKSCLK